LEFQIAFSPYPGKTAIKEGAEPLRTNLLLLFFLR